MGWAVLQQPNGKLAVFSTIVDDFILLEGGAQDVEDLFVDDSRRTAERNAAQALELVRRRGSSSYAGTTWESALATVRDIHGPEKAALREAYRFADDEVDDDKPPEDPDHGGDCDGPAQLGDIL